jgi:hypothetical protein
MILSRICVDKVFESDNGVVDIVVVVVAVDVDVVAAADFFRLLLTTASRTMATTG